MVLIDYIVIFITLVYSLMGIVRGFSKQLLSFLSWSVMLYLIFYHFGFFTNFVSEYISLDFNYIRILTVFLLVVLTIILVFLLNLTLAKLLASTVFEHTNKIFGLLISLIKSQIYIFIFVLLVLDTSFHSEIFNDSILIPYYVELVNYISNYDDSLFNSFEI